MRIEVNGILIDPELIRAHAAFLRDQARAAGCDLSPEYGLELLEEAAKFTTRLELLRQEAARQSVTGDQLVAAWCATVGAPRARDVREIYVKNRESFWRSAARLVLHIVKNVNHEDEWEPLRAEMLRIHGLLVDGADFAAIADEHSDCPGDGGSLGYISAGEMVPEFDQVVFCAAVGEITPVFSTRFGVHIALVSEIRPEGIPPFAEVAPNIERVLLQERENAAINHHIEQLRSKAVVRVSGA